MDNLTYREKQIIMYLERGYSNQKIASILCTSPATIANALTRLFEKTGHTNRTQLALAAQRNSLIKTQNI